MQKLLVRWLRLDTWTSAGLLVALLGCMLLPVPRAMASEDLLGQLKAAYIFNFTRFVEWPMLPEDRPFVIGVIGDPQMVSQLRVLEREGKLVGGRRIQIRSYVTIEKLAESQLLFVGNTADPKLEQIRQRTAGQPTLLVGDTPGQAGRGVAIEFFLKPDVFRKRQRLRFRIDPKALEGRGLTVSAQLLDVAEILP